MLELLAVICKLIKSGIEKKQAVYLAVSTLSETDKVQAVAYFHKQFSDN